MTSLNRINKKLYHFDFTKCMWVILVALILGLAFAGLFLKYEQQSILYQGGCDQQSSPYLENRKEDGYLITYCEGGDSYVGNIETSSFIAKSYVLVDLSGYPENNDIKIELLSSDGRFKDLDFKNSGEIWETQLLKIPSEFVGDRLKLVLSDNATDAFGWAGVKVDPNYTNLLLFEFINSLLTLFLVFLSFSIVFLLAPGKSRLEQFSFFLVFSGVIAYTFFFIYFYNPAFGRLASITLYVLCVVYLIFLLVKKRFDIHRLELFLLPFCYSALLIFVVWFPNFDLSDSSVPATKWIGLPIDNWLPKIFGDQLLLGKVTTPMLGDWLSSDRGPIQTGFYVFLSPLLGSFDGFYQTLGTSLQSLALIPVGFIIKLFFREKGFLYFSLLVFAFSSLFLVNSVFVWPKLLALTYCAACFLLFFASSNHTEGKDVSLKVIFLIGILAGLSLLSHGSTFFSLLAIPLLYLIKTLFESGRFVNERVIFLAKFALQASFCFFLFMLPWILYQKFVDPPGDRLLKWHFAGQIAPIEGSFFSVLSAAYEALTLEQWVSARYANLIEIVKGNFFLDIKRVVFDGADRSALISSSFFNLFYSMWFFNPLFIYLIWFVGRNFQDNSFSPFQQTHFFWFFLVTVFTGVFWCIFMYIPGSTVIHQGSYFFWVGCMLISMVLVRCLSIWVFYILSAMNIAIANLIYLSSTELSGLEPLYYSVYLLLTCMLLISTWIFANEVMRSDE